MQFYKVIFFNALKTHKGSKYKTVNEMLCKFGIVIAIFRQQKEWFIFRVTIQHSVYRGFGLIPWS